MFVCSIILIFSFLKLYLNERNDWYNDCFDWAYIKYWIVRNSLNEKLNI